MNKRIQPAQGINRLPAPSGPMKPQRMPFRPNAPKQTIGRVERITPSPNPAQPGVSQIRNIVNTMPEFRGGSEGPAPSTLENVAMGNRPGDASPYNGRFGVQMQPKPVQNADQKMAVMDSLKRAFSKNKQKPQMMGGAQ